MADSGNQKVLREFCTISGCEVWKAIQAAEKGEPSRSPLRRHCPDKCPAYQFLKFLDGGNFEIRRRHGYMQYHQPGGRKSGKRT